jgi:hypothetical protein
MSITPEHIASLNLCWRHGTLKGMTPAQAAGLSDHGWALSELLTFNAAITSKIT